MALGRPHIAIVDPNALATIGLRQLLQTVVPMMAVDVYPTFDAFLAGGGEGCYHYFVAQSVAVAHHLWFMDRRRKTLVLTLSSDPHSQLAGFRHLCVGVAEEALVCEVLRLVQQGHSGGRNLPTAETDAPRPTLTPREEKVLKLRFGIEDGRPRTLEEVGKEFNVTRERIRQIEAKALRKLRHPSRSKKLKDFLN